MATKKKYDADKALARSIQKGKELGEKNVSIKLARRVLEVVDKGLCSGVGDPIPGQMCVEAAVCYAMGSYHSDSPSCVDRNVRATKIALNDMSWSSNKARAKGLRRVAIAQLGSVNLPAGLFTKRLAIRLMNDILIPYSLEKLKEDNMDEFIAGAQKAFDKVKACEQPNKWLKILKGEKDHGGSTTADEFAESMRWDSQSATYVDTVLSEWLFDGRGKRLTKNEYDRRLTIVADCIEKTLKECKSPGVKWLHLCKAD